MRTKVVIDACMALKWEFRDEDHAAAALVLLSRTIEGYIELVAPVLWLYEVVNVFCSAAATSFRGAPERCFVKEKSRTVNVLRLDELARQEVSRGR